MINLVTKDLSTNELESFTGIFDKLHKNLLEALSNSQPQKICDFNENIELKITDVLGTRGLRDFFFNQNIKVGTILKILKKSNNTIFLLIENKEIELDKKDTYNLIAIPNL